MMGRDLPGRNDGRVFTSARAVSLDTLADRELLKLFARKNDGSAFRELVTRHGNMVRGVCLRVLRDPHDVEDAFQATFLVLVRKAASLRHPDLLANWLYGVAYRTALNAKAQAGRRRHYEREAASMSDTRLDHDELRQELLAALDHALESLPDKYRAPLVLCYLQGKTNEQASRQLNCPAGSMSSLLARARALLRERLTGLPAGMLGVLLAAIQDQGRRAVAVPDPLVGRTVQAALGMTRGKALGLQLISPTVGSLVGDTLQDMAATNLRKGVGVIFAVVLSAGMVVATSSVVAGWQPTDKDPGRKPPAAATVSPLVFQDSPQFPNPVVGGMEPSRGMGHSGGCAGHRP